MKVKLMAVPRIELESADGGEIVKFLMLGRVEQFLLPPAQRRQPGLRSHSPVRLADMTTAGINVLAVQTNPKCSHCGEPV